MSDKDKTDKKFEEMFNYLMEEAGPDATYGGGYEMPYDAEGGHTKEEADAEYAKLFRELHGIPEDEDIPDARKPNINIVGHINPDTDTIVAAMAYANLKNSIDDTSIYTAARAGRINEETQFVLEQTSLEAPDLLTSAGTQIMDIDIRDLPGVSDSITLRWAWELLKERGIVTLPITDKIQVGNETKEKLKGLITVRDIGNIYLDTADPDLLAQAKTPYENIREAVDGEFVLDNSKHRIENGKIVVGAADSELLSDYVKKDDAVIVSNRKESHNAAIDAGASLIIVTMGSTIDDETIELAKANDCAIITTKHDTYTSTRLMNQSIPVSFVMVTDKLVTFNTTDYLDHVKKVMARQKHRDFPVLDEDGFYVGMISRRFLVDTRKKKVILVDHNEKSQAIEDINDAEILEIIDHHRLSSVETIEPVFFRNEPVGSTSTIVYEMYKENGVEVNKEYALLMCSGILSDTLIFKSPTTTQKDKLAAIELANTAGIDMTKFSSSMFRAGSEAGDKSPHELISQDFKKFTVDGNDLGIGQFNSMEKSELADIKEKIIPHLEDEKEKKRLDMLFFMLTDIVAGKTEILFIGEDAKDILEEAFEMEVESDTLIVEGLISRKKQMVPEIISAMQQ